MDSSESLAEKTASLISIGEEQFISFSNFNDPILFKLLRFEVHRNNKLKECLLRLPNSTFHQD